MKRDLDVSFLANCSRKVAREHGIELGNCPVDREDLSQEAALCWLGGRKSVKGPMQDLLRKEYGRYYERRGNVFSLDQWKEQAKTEQPERATALPDLRFLNPQSRAVLHMRYWLGMEYLQIGAEMGFGESRAKQIEIRAVNKLRRNARNARS